MPKCPECGSQRIWKDGLRYRHEASPVQRYLCRSCGYRFSETKVKVDISIQGFKKSNARHDLSNMSITGAQVAIEKRFDSLLFQRGEDVASHGVTIVAKPINSLRDYNREHRVSTSEREAKNLAKLESETRKVAGATTTTQADMKGLIVEFSFWMLKQGYREATIKGRVKVLRLLAKRGADLYDPESVKTVIAQQSTWSEGTKASAVVASTASSLWQV